MSFAKGVVYLGITLVIVGALIYLIAKLGIPIGKLPGDFVMKGKNYSMYFPLTTSLLLSAILTFLASLVLYFARK